MEHLCIQCEEIFGTSDELEVHQSYYQVKKQFSCSHCDQHFSKSGHLKTHNMTHIRKKDYECLQCGKTFKKLDKLQTQPTCHTLARSILGALSVTSPARSLVTLRNI